MPNTGMLDHRSYQPVHRASQSEPGSYAHWFNAWPSKAGYKTARSYKVSSFSRHLIKQMQPQLERQLLSSQRRPGSASPHAMMGNSMSPFHTSMKPTCGYNFSEMTDNRKKSFGIPPSNIVAWRSSQRTNSAPIRLSRTA